MEKKEFQKIFKDTLAYYLTTENINFKDLYEHEMPSFEVTNNPKDFFIWIWEEFYGNEDFKIKDLDLYYVDDDKGHIRKFNPYY